MISDLERRDRKHWIVNGGALFVAVFVAAILGVSLPIVILALPLPLLFIMLTSPSIKEDIL
jgi:hypothetical protein